MRSKRHEEVRHAVVTGVLLGVGIGFSVYVDWRDYSLETYVALAYFTGVSMGLLIGILREWHTESRSRAIIGVLLNVVAIALPVVGFAILGYALR